MDWAALGQPTQPLFTFAKRRDVAINLKHGLIAEQLHTAVYDDFAAIFTEMTEFTGPITVVPKSRITSARSIGNLVRKREWLLRPIASSEANP